MNFFAKLLLGELFQLSFLIEKFFSDLFMSFFLSFEALELFAKLDKSF